VAATSKKNANQKERKKEKRSPRQGMLEVTYVTSSQSITEKKAGHVALEETISKRIVFSKPYIEIKIPNFIIVFLTMKSKN